MKVKVFQTNHNGKIELTPAELEKLLNETFEEGYREGYREPRFNDSFGNFKKWPKDGFNPYCQELTITPTEKSISQSVNETVSTSTTVGSDSNTGTTAAPLTCSVKVSNADMQTLAKTIEEIISEANKAVGFSKPSNDVFANLAKELNF